MAKKGKKSKKGKKGPAVPAEAEAFPGVRVGDVLYSGDLDGGIYRCVVVRILDGDYVRVVLGSPELDGDDGRVPLSWGDDGDFTSIAAALRKAALRDIKYHEPRLQFAKECLAAIERGDDLTRFAAGHDFD